MPEAVSRGAAVVWRRGTPGALRARGCGAAPEGEARVARAPGHRGQGGGRRPERALNPGGRPRPQPGPKESTRPGRPRCARPCGAPSRREAGRSAGEGRLSSRSQPTESPQAARSRWRTPPGYARPAAPWVAEIARGQTGRRPAVPRLPRAIAAGALTTGVVWQRARWGRRPQGGEGARRLSGPAPGHDHSPAPACPQVTARGAHRACHGPRLREGRADGCALSGSTHGLSAGQRTAVPPRVGGA